MGPEDVRRHLRKKPFQPFRITLTDGRTLDVRHPELVMVGFTALVVGLPRPTEPEPIYDRLVDVSLSHVMQIEPLEPSATSKA